MAISGWPGELLDRAQSWGFLYRYYEKRVLRELDSTALPRHIAVLADGNRRWARTNAPGKPLVVGYQAGADKLKEFVGWCSELGIPLVTLWVLSTDNLRRSEGSEIAPLLEVIQRLFTDLASIADYRVQMVGDASLLPEEMAATIHRAEVATAQNSGCHVNVAIAYGGRHELRDAVRSLLSSEDTKGNTLNQLAESLEIDDIAEHLYTAGQPDPDLIIRTSGEQRMSGFLIWQAAHSEFYFCEALWPDFRKVDFVRALRSYAQRERRFGR